MGVGGVVRVGSALLTVLALSSCALLTPLPEESAVPERLEAIPKHRVPLQKPVLVHWNEHQVPFIEAKTDEDLAVALGLVHAHLRLGQMEILRRISQGRISEMAGPVAIDIDRSLRILDFDRAVPDMLKVMPAETRRWLEAYVRGVNHYLFHAETLPHEFELMGLEREAWRVSDLLTIGRMASSDVNWFAWFALLRYRDRPDWPALWSAMVEAGRSSIPSFVPDMNRNLVALNDLLAGHSRSGSNAVAVAGAHSVSGAALMASDPHLGIQVPNFWIIAGYKSPSYHLVGLMVPGLPFAALGRNPWIAWGGTNMRAASSDLFDAADLPDADITMREEPLRVRWWFDTEATVRTTNLGPIITDAPVLESVDGENLVLRWTGHLPSDEVTALLKVNQARNWDDFRAAFGGFAVPGQNMLYADRDGHIGQVLAVALPRRPAGPPADLVAGPDALRHWDSFVTAPELPVSFDPPSGFLASANNRPVETEVPIGFFFSPNDRIRRLSELLADRRISRADLEALQRDVTMPSALALRDSLLSRLPPADALAPDARPLLGALEAWDGRYAEDSAGALALDLLLHHFLAAFYAPDERSLLAMAPRARDGVREDLDNAPEALLGPALDTALSAAVEDFARFGTWGRMHRLGLAHPASFAPAIGARYRFGDFPAAGASHTVMKTAHAITAERHHTRYGSNARHISDLADLDENYFVLLGGQDGWLNSSTFLDQVPLWRRGAYIRMPLRLETVRRDFRHKTPLLP